MIYKFGFCPHCGKKISIHNSMIGGVYSDYIDVPYKECPYCGKTYATGKKLYSEMNEQEREKIDNLIVKETVNNAGVYIIILCVILGFIYMVLFGKDINSISKESIIIIFLIVCACSFIKGYLAAKKTSDYIKKL